MSLISLPTGFCPNAFSLRLQTTQRMFTPPFGGSEQVIDLLNDRWLLSLSLPNRTFAQAAAVEAFIAALRGMTNTVALYHWARKVPRGTMRGTPIVNPAAAGTDVIMIGVDTAGETLLAGDLIGIGGMLLMVAEDTVENGLGGLPVKLVNKLRRDLVFGEPVVWDRPSAIFRLASPSAVQFIPGYAPEVSFDFVEAIA